MPYTGPQGPPGVPGISGATYIRWGRTVCPTTPGTERVYSGFAAGSRYDEMGGGSNFICLPEEPQNQTSASSRADARAHVFGAEYEITGFPILQSVNNHNVPCALCYTATRGTATVIPAMTNCPTPWTTEYSGYLMAGRHNQEHSPKFECVDGAPETLPNSAADLDGSRFFLTQTRCGGICPPYQSGRDLYCAVCTR